MPTRLLPVLLLLCASTALPAAAQTVSVENGNVHYADRNGARRQLTRTGHDSDAALSPDGRTVAFVRATPDHAVETGSGDAQATELWTVGVDGTDARMRLRGRQGDDPERILAAFQQPAFSPDGRTLYFLSAAWATSGAVHALDLATGAERYVCPGNSLEVVPRGPHAGHLIVTQHRYFLGGGSYDWAWLVTPDGADVGPIGEGEGALAAFRETYTNPPSR